jgi:hypothetical protein
MVVIAAYMAATLASAIRHEEASMRAAFGDQYDQYAASRAKPVARPFSLARAIKNKEHKSIAGLAAVGALFAVKAFFFN